MTDPAPEDRAAAQPHGGLPPPWEEEAHFDDGPDFWGRAAVMVEQRWAIFRLTSAIFTVGLLVLLLLRGPDEFVSTASFFPQEAPNAMSRVAGLVAQLGVSTPTPGSSESPAFYADLLTSRTILSGLVEMAYRIASDSGVVVGDLISLIGPAVVGDNRDRPREAVIRKLRRDVLRISLTRETGVVELEVAAHDPTLAQQIAQNAIHLVQQFNIWTRQSQAAAERQFVEVRLAKVQDELMSAE